MKLEPRKVDKHTKNIKLTFMEHFTIERPENKKADVWFLNANKVEVSQFYLLDSGGLISKSESWPVVSVYLDMNSCNDKIIRNKLKCFK